MLLSEIDRSERCKIQAGIEPVDTINWNVVAKREIQRLDESFFECPQSVFFLTLDRPGMTGAVRLVGRKVLSDMWVDFKTSEIHCYIVTAEMVLGMFVDQPLTDSQVRLFYHPLTKPEKLRFMAYIGADGGKCAELVFPFPLLRESNHREWGTPPVGWPVNATVEAELATGEERLRTYTAQWLQWLGTTNPVIYYPGCSTGTFLASMKAAIPGCRTIGQYLSQAMVDYSMGRVDEVYCGNAMVPLIKPGTADFVFVRFINSVVVMTTEAERLLEALIPTVKPGGYMVLYGFTVVLLSSSNFRCLGGFELKQCIGCAVDGSGIFQYYVLKKKLLLKSLACVVNDNCLF